MLKHFFQLFCAILGGLIFFSAGIIGQRLGWISYNAYVVEYACLAAGIIYVLLLPTIGQKMKHLLCDYDWAEESVRLYKSVPKVYRKSFWFLFGFINLAFLFHTINFMWGNEDWAAVRSAVNPGEGVARGAFSLYWWQELLFDGKILPVINNLVAFAGLSLAGVLLAVYWNLPKKVLPIVICGLLFAVTPYTLAVLYFAKISLGVCLLPAMVLVALLLAEKKGEDNLFTYLYNIISVLLLLWALGTYMPVINLIAILLLGKVLLKTVVGNLGFYVSFQSVKQGIANFTAALMIYWLIWLVLFEIGRITPRELSWTLLSEPLFRLPKVCWYALVQFALPLPFMELGYKILYLAAAVLALFVLIYKAPTFKASLRGLLLVPFLLLASVLALAFLYHPAEHVAQMTFFGLPFLFALLFVMLIRLGGGVIYRVTYVVAILLIFMNFVRVAYAEKVWKFGWDAETKLAERIITRLEKMPEFDINRQYKLLQIGEKSLRAKYYLKDKYEVDNGALLGRAYYASGKAKDAYNFFYQTDFLSEDAKADALNEPVIRDFLLNKAQAWPAQNSLLIYGSYIVLILDEAQLAFVQRIISQN